MVKGGKLSGKAVLMVTCEVLSSVWGHSSLRKLRSYCVHKCKGKVSEDVGDMRSIGKWRAVCKDGGTTIECASSEW